MNADLTDLITNIQSVWFSAFLVFLRVGAMMAILPAFGERSIPERVRLILAVCFTVIVYPAVSSMVDVTPQSGAGYIKLMATEMLAGLLLGIGLRLFVMALQIAGAIIAQSTSLSQIFGGGAVDAQPAMGHVLLTAGLALAVMLGLHVRVAELLIESYFIFPIGQPIPSLDVVEWGTKHISHVFALGFTLSAPFVIGSLIYNVALGVINRAMPQLMVAFVGAPAITFGGLLLFFVTVPFLLEIWQKGFAKLLLNPFGGQ